MATKIENLLNAQVYCLEESRRLAHNVWLFFTSSDRFLGEFIPIEDNIIYYLTGFSGENGTLLVSAQEAILWVDSRFFLQAPKQVFSNVTIKHYEDTDFKDYLKSLISHKDNTLLMDGRYVNASMDDILKTALCDIYDVNLFDQLWSDKINPNWGPLSPLNDDISGGSVLEKIKEARSLIERYQANALWVSLPEDVSYLINAREHSTPYTILVQGHLLIGKDFINIYIESDASALEPQWKALNIKVYSFNKEEEHLKDFNGSILLYKPVVTYRLFKQMQHPILLEHNYFEDKRSIKTPTQLKLIKEDFALEDCIFSYFLYLIKSQQITSEFEGSQKLEELRKLIGRDRYIGPSFASIIAYGDNSAIVHYTPTVENSAPMGQRGFVLCDVGGQYANATTDATRTVMIGCPQEYEKIMYTRVLKGHIALEKVSFPRGLNGSHLDSLCRQFLWEIGKDYGHGTGHGVDACGAVHAGPNSFSQRSYAWSFTEGMLTSDEPGYYEEGHFGIRLENVINCINKGKINQEKDRLGFESMAHIPFDKDCIDFTLLEPSEYEWLKNYQNETIDFLFKQCEKLKEALGSSFDCLKYQNYLNKLKIGE